MRPDMGCMMSDHQFWLSDTQFVRIQPNLPNKVRCVPRIDDCRVVSGIIDVIRYGLIRRHALSEYGPRKTLYNRFVCWSEAGVFDRIFAALADESRATGTAIIDATHLKARRTAASLLKKGLFRAVSDASGAASTRNCTRSAAATARPRS